MTLHAVIDAARPLLMETLTIGEGHHPVARPVNDAGRPFVFGGSLIDRQPESGLDLIPTQLQAAEHLHIRWWVQRIIHLTHRIASNGVITQHRSRSQ